LIASLRKELARNEADIRLRDCVCTIALRKPASKSGAGVPGVHARHGKALHPGTCTIAIVDEADLDRAPGSRDWKSTWASTPLMMLRELHHSQPSSTGGTPRSK
jgi:hypothetical protein